MDPAKYKTLFISETREYLQSMSQQVLKLSQSPSPDLYDRLFRCAHSIKGMAASMGYSTLTQVSHQLEDLFDKLKKGELPLGEEIVSLMFSGLDLMESMVGEIEQTGDSQVSPAYFVHTMEMVQAKTEKTVPAIKPELEIISSEDSAPVYPAFTGEAKFFYKIDLRIADDATLPGARAIVVLKRMEELGKISKSTPTAEEIAAGNFQKQLTSYFVTSYTSAELQQMLGHLPDIGSISIVPVDPYTRQGPVGQASEIVSQEAPQEGLKVTSVRVETRMVDHVVEGLGELLILNAQLQENYPSNPEMARLQILTQKLYEHALDLRMLPFETLSGRFPRIIYDLGKKLQKKVQIKVEGSEIRLDKSILDELADPLIHLLRNAVDHGIEAPPLRTMKGKSETGNIVVSLSKQGDRVLIRVEDDGKGLDADLIRKTAVKKGMISERSASFLNQQEVFMLITRPGFSTASEVSDISGRGVGLDVVYSKIEALGGSFKMYSTSGQSTRFEIIIPFTIAVIPALLFRSGSLVYAVPVSRVDRFLLIRKKDMHYTQGRPVVFYENSTIYIEKLDALLGKTNSVTFEDEFQAFVTEHQNRRIAWCVDELLAERQIMLKSLGEPLNLIPCYSGATVLGKGEVIPVLDLEQLYRERYQ